jgi:NodT family efflux transporter outer membrane factor (OMF) lipoprotein
MGRQRRVSLRAAAALGAASVAWLAACAPDLGPKVQLEAPATLASDRTLAAPVGDWPADEWWQRYGDPELNTLTEEGLAGSPTLKVAEARMREARASALAAGAALWPTITGDAEAQPTKQSLNNGFPPQIQTFLPHGWHTQTRVAGDLDYELDFFGKNRAALAAATSDAKAAEIDVAEARLVLSTSIASAYSDLVRLAADRDTADEAVRVREQSAKLVSDREKEGLENKGAVDQAEAEVASAQASEDTLDGQIAVTRNEIAALLGKGPDRGLDIAVPKVPHIETLGLPPKLALDLIGRRPDIVAAKLRAESASDRIDVAHADFYPNIDLTGYLGFESLDIGKVFEKASLIGQIGPALHLPIFDGGKIEGNYRGARASYDEAVANYDGTLVNALHEVADAVVNERELTAQLAHSRESLDASEGAYRIALLRYRGGLSRYLDVLTTEDTLLAQRQQVADLEGREFAQNIALIRALGGGFSSNA